VHEALKGWTVLAVSVMYQVLSGLQEAPLLHGDVAGHLHHPWLVRMRRRAGDVHLPTREVDEKEHVVRDQACRCPDLSGEEVRGDQHLHMRADKLLPCGRRLALGSRCDAMALEDVAYCLVTDREAQVGEGSNDPVIAPGAILFGHTHDQGLD